VKLIQPQLQGLLGPGFTIEEIKAKPLYLSVGGIGYEDPYSKRRFLEIEEIRIYPALLSFLKPPLRIREIAILQPSFRFYRSQEGVFVGPWTATGEKKEKEEISPKKEGEKEEPIHIRIDRLRINRGSVDLEDRKVGDPSGEIKIRDLDLDVKDIQIPIISVHSPIEFRGKFVGKTKEGSIYLKGWIDLKTMDMENSLRTRQVEVKIFEPYYRKRVSAEIESGYINMDANIVVKNRTIDAPIQLELDDLHIRKGGGSVLWVPANTLASLLEGRKHRIQAQFHVEGSLDDPKFSLQEAFLTRIAFSFAEAMGIPIKGVGEEILKGTLKGEKGLAEEMKSFEQLFGKKKEKRK
jgi:hypothetical protein